MPYLDGTETLPDGDGRPRFCPRCGKESVEARWYGVGVKFFHNEPRAIPAFVCLGCGIAVQIRKLPEGKLRRTRKQARIDAEKQHARELATYRRKHSRNP